MSALEQQPQDDARKRSRRRVRVIKDLLVFQVKLLLEGFKDIVLGPVSLAAALLDFIAANDAPDRYLDAVMRLGRRYEEGLDLYAALEAPGEQPEGGTVVRQASPPLAASAHDEALEHRVQP